MAPLLLQHPAPLSPPHALNYAPNLADAFIFGAVLAAVAAALLSRCATRKAVNSAPVVQMRMGVPASVVLAGMPPPGFARRLEKETGIAVRAEARSTDAAARAYGRLLAVARADCVVAFLGGGDGGGDGGDSTALEIGAAAALGVTVVLVDAGRGARRFPLCSFVTGSAEEAIEMLAGGLPLHTMLQLPLTAADEEKWPRAVRAPRDEVLHLFSRLDADADGRVPLRDAVVRCAPAYFGSRFDAARRAAHAADADGRGSLTLAQFRAFLGGGAGHPIGEFLLTESERSETGGRGGRDRSTSDDEDLVRFKQLSSVITAQFDDPQIRKVWADAAEQLGAI